MSAGFSKRLANFTISLFQSLRVEESFRSFYNVVLKIMKKKKRITIYFRAKVKPANVVRLIIPLLITLVVAVINKMMCTILIHLEATIE